MTINGGVLDQEERLSVLKRGINKSSVSPRKLESFVSSRVIRIKSVILPLSFPKGGTLFL